MRDPAFESELFQLLMKMLGVKKLRTTGYYNPRAMLDTLKKGMNLLRNILLRM